MKSQITLFTVCPEDLVLRVKAGDGEAAMSMGLLCLTGLGVKQNLDQAGSYFSKARQLGIKDAGVLIAYIYECNDCMIKAIDTYVGKDVHSNKEGSYASRISQLFKDVQNERKRLNKLLDKYGLPECPLYTTLNNLLEELDTGRRSLSDICSIISLSDTNEKWFYNTAWLFYEEGDEGISSMWLKKCHPDPDDELFKLIRARFEELTLSSYTPVDLKNDSLLDKKLSVRILPESLFMSGDTTKKLLTEWSRECNNRKQAYLAKERRLEEERQRKMEEERRKAEEEKKRRDEEERIKAEEAKRRVEEEARKRAEERTFIVGRYGRQRDEILDKTVSRQHCRVSLLDDGMVEIENLSKSNGTVINGEKIEKVKVSMDSELKMGNYIIIIRDLFPPRKTPTGPDKQTTT